MHSSVSNFVGRQHHASFSILFYLFYLRSASSLSSLQLFLLLVVFLLLRAKVHSVLHESWKTLSRKIHIFFFVCLIVFFCVNSSREFLLLWLFFVLVFCIHFDGYGEEDRAIEYRTCTAHDMIHTRSKKNKIETKSKQVFIFLYFRNSFFFLFRRAIK